MENQSNQNQAQTSYKILQKEYQEALLQSGIQAADLLAELISLKIMPDPRAKEMADVALEVIKLINGTPAEIIKFNSEDTTLQTLSDTHTINDRLTPEAAIQTCKGGTSSSSSDQERI